MHKKYLAIDLRGYPTDLYQNVCRVTPADRYTAHAEGFSGVEVKSTSQLKRLPKADLVFARGGGIKRNRKFLKSKKIDILAHPYPFDTFQARLAAEHGIAVELCFREIEVVTKYIRARLLKQLRSTTMLAKKYHAPLIITSGARCEAEVKAPRTLVAFGRILGLDYPEAKACIWNIPKKVLEGVE